MSDHTHDGPLANEQVSESNQAEGVGAPKASGRRRRGRGSRLNAFLGVLVVVLIGAVVGVGYLALQKVEKQKVPTTLAGSQVSSIEQKIKANPKDLSLYLSLADAKYQAKDYDGALHDLETMRSLDPTGTPLALNIYAVAQIADTRGDTAAAERGYRESLKIEKTASAAYSLGALCLKKKNYGDAITYLEMYIGFATQGDAVALKDLAGAYEKVGNTAKALETYKKAQSYVPDDADMNAAIKRLESK